MGSKALFFLLTTYVSFVAILENTTFQVDGVREMASLQVSNAETKLTRTSNTFLALANDDVRQNTYIPKPNSKIEGGAVQAQPNGRTRFTRKSVAHANTDCHEHDDEPNANPNHHHQNTFSGFCDLVCPSFQLPDKNCQCKRIKTM